jgi:hypothetical protein
MRSNIYVRRVRAGEFVIINKHLVRSLMAEGLWTKKVTEPTGLETAAINHSIILFLRAGSGRNYSQRRLSSKYCVYFSPHSQLVQDGLGDQAAQPYRYGGRSRGVHRPIAVPKSISRASRPRYADIDAFSRVASRSQNRDVLLADEAGC